jgi:hypothetical protein
MRRFGTPVRVNMLQQHHVSTIVFVLRAAHHLGRRGQVRCGAVLGDPFD